MRAVLRATDYRFIGDQSPNEGIYSPWRVQVLHPTPHATDALMKTLSTMVSRARVGVAINREPRGCGLDGELYSKDEEDEGH